jgi:protease I
MNKVLILVESGCEELRLWVPYYRFLEAELDVVLVGPEAGSSYMGKHGLPARADVSFVQANLDEVRAALIPGGWAPDRLRVQEAAVDLVRTAVATWVDELAVDGSLITSRTPADLPNSLPAVLPAAT